MKNRRALNCQKSTPAAEPDPRASLGLLTGVVLPLIARKQVVGVIFIFRTYSRRLFRQ